MTGTESETKRIFCEALERGPGPRRREYLDRACGDRAMRSRVEELLRAHDDADDFLECPAVRLAPTPGSSVVPGPGTAIGPYRLLEPIGEGGMGIVYLARQEQPVRREVALKVIKPGMDTRQVIARFESERRALALMDHLHIARVLDAGATDGGRPYFVMELVRGVPITEYCDQEGLSIPERLRLFIPVCQAVQHAHQKGIIHRDLKPSNVLVTLVDGAPVPKVIDFGLAKATGLKLTEKTAFTGLAQLIGSPLYMSPEQAEPTRSDLDTRSDIYSLGVVLYELLTGRTPFDPETLRSLSFDELRGTIREVDPPRPSLRLGALGATLTDIAARRGCDPRRLVRQVRGELDWIVMKAIEKGRDRRYDTAYDLARDIQRCLRNEPLEAGPPGMAYRLRKIARRHRVYLMTAAAFAGLLIVGASLCAWQALRATAAERRAERAAREAEAEAAVARAVNDFLRKDLLDQSTAEGQSSPSVVPRPDLTVRAALDRAASSVRKRFADQPLVEAAIRSTIGNAYHALGEYAAARPHLERARALYLRERGPAHPETLAVTGALGRLHQARGELAEAEALFSEARKCCLARLGEAHPETPVALANMAELVKAQGRLAKAERLMKRALDGYRRTRGPDQPGTLAATNDLAMIYKTQGRLSEAESLVRVALEGRRRTLGDGHPQTLSALSNLGMLLKDQGRLAAAEPLLTAALEGCRRAMGEDHPQTLTEASNLASLYLAQGRTAEAEPLFARALEGRRRVLGECHPDTLAGLYHSALLRKKCGRLAEAEPLLVEFLNHVGPDDRSGDRLDRLSHALSLLGDVRMGLGRPAEAELDLRRSLEIRERTHPGDWSTERIRSLLGSCLSGQGWFAKAEPVLLKAHAGLEAQTAKMPPAKACLEESVNRIIKHYEDWGKPEEAVPWRERLGRPRSS
jgi:serine/threonine protein kinase/tetratricopeptide (TPR) repeat protein